DRPLALAIVILEEGARFVRLLVEDHDPDPDDSAVGISVAQRIEHDGMEPMAFEEGAGKLGLIGPVEARCFDQTTHHGTTAPAETSSGRGARPSIALRCGKRPNRAMTSRWSRAYLICSSSPSSVNNNTARF